MWCGGGSLSGFARARSNLPGGLGLWRESRIELRNKVIEILVSAAFFMFEAVKSH